MRSIGGRFAVTLVMTTTAVGVAGFFAGRSALEQVAALADDDEVAAALEDGRKALRDWARLRQGTAADKIENCLVSETSACDIPGATVRFEPLPEAPEAARWLDENTYASRAPDGRGVKAVLAWPEIKPRFDKFGEVLGRREHLTQLLPGLLSSFLTTFAAALLVAALLGLVATWLTSRRLVRRVGALVGYTKDIGRGQLAPAPASTRGKDEVGLLAGAIETMTRDLDQARRRLITAEKMASWQQVARKVAHEIKNPLTPISLVASELLRRAPAQDAENARFLDEAGRVLAEECASLERMVREFTRFARLPSPELAANDLGVVLRDFVARNAQQTGPELIVQIAEGPSPARLDAAMIAQVLHNLVNNAARAKEPARARVTFTLARDGDTARLTVADDAGGVPEALRATLFDAYVTSRSTGEAEKGMGLGLTIARKIALDHGGALDLTATGPKGSVFTLTLPLTEGAT